MRAEDLHAARARRLCRRAHRAAPAHPVARPDIVDDAGTHYGMAPGSADEPRQYPVDAQGQRVRLRVSRAIRVRTCGTRGRRAGIPFRHGGEKPVRLLSRPWREVSDKRDAIPAMKIYSVGGAVRDEVLGRPVADRDYVVVGATPEAMLAQGFRPVGRDFPVFLHPQTNEECALARTERKSGHGYHGFTFHAAPDVTLEADLARRDLTINAMARDADGVLIDPYGGEADLRAGVLRHVSAAFAEDPLRILRVARFAARLGFAVAPETEALMRAIVSAGELATLTPERVWQEFARALMEARPSRFFFELRRCGALALLLPEIDALFGVPQPIAHHPELDAGVHVLQAVDFSAAAGDPLPVRYAVLAHDLGKATTAPADWPRHIPHEAKNA